MPWEANRWVGPDPTVEELGVTTCFCCRSEDVPLKAYGHIMHSRRYDVARSFNTPPFKALCYLCAATYASTMEEYPDGRDSDVTEIAKAICFVGNEILKELRKPR